MKLMLPLQKAAREIAIKIQFFKSLELSVTGKQFKYVLKKCSKNQNDLSSHPELHDCSKLVGSAKVRLVTKLYSF